ncbi:vWA domain-containing protein [Marinibacterium profundimaris]|uniref:von Willebrand factor A n=1 Tax=Marinibacterium profundimaris TaxID=1679460 RepID=A0A225NSM8_9RHOB|nr:VWA domain-containing protein [Marinibacterium profundimaris]OWU77852.1 von Willebrand factor A [Marinibacterium profundimaris]
MPEFPALDLPENPKLAGNITHFARALRKAGLRVGTGRVIDAIRAVEAAGFTSKTDFYWTLHACFVSRPEDRVVFAQVFRLYWRDPRYMEHMMSMMLPAIRGVQEERAGQSAEKRAAQALLDGMQPEMPDEFEEPEGTEIEIDATLTMSAEERLKSLDFEQMSTEEVAQAKRMLARLDLPVDPIPSRRGQAALRGSQIDWRRTMRASMRQGGEIRDLARKAPRERWPNLVVLCDISGSMSQYSRLILHFVHTVANAKGQGWAKVHAFTFGTRLTNVTRHLRQRDVDAALKAAGAEAQDWEGGTRIGECLHAFNRDWSRRVTGQGAVVLLVSDGLDRGAPEDLAKEMQRLHLSARRLIWLNPLLRWEGFAPKAKGIAAMLPHVDSFRAGHSIASLEDLAKVISRWEDAGEKARLMRML